MPSWFDLMTLDATGPEDEAGIKSASALVTFVTIVMILMPWHDFCFGEQPDFEWLCTIV